MNRIAIAIVTFFASIIVFTQLHVVAINYIYTEPTTDYNIIGGLSEKDEKKAMEITKQDNIVFTHGDKNANTNKHEYNR